MKNKKHKGLLIAGIAGLIILVIGLWTIFNASSNKQKPDSTLAENISPFPSLKPTQPNGSSEDKKRSVNGTEQASQADSNLSGIFDGIGSEPVKPTSKADDFPSPTTAPVEQLPDMMEPDFDEKAASDNATSLIRISREEAGLDTIQQLNFDRFTLHERIQELLDGKPYTHEDMKKGIVEPCLVTERFQAPILEDISIGTGIDQVIETLGVPTIQNDDMVFYKTHRYYVCFIGDEKVEAVNFAPIPELQNEDILNSVLTALCIDNIYLLEYLNMSQEASDFFGSVGHIHGGGNYAISTNGIEVETFSGTIEIFNNFEGFLYRIDGESEADLEICYTNADSIMDDLRFDYWSYTSGNRQFAENGKTSPSGKYSAIYEWITSDHHYFTIRTNDHSAPDYIIGAEASDFEWINDDYIVYTTMFSTLPVVMRPAEYYEKWEVYLLMPGIDELDYFYSFGDHNFTIAQVNEDSIILRDNNVDSTDREEFWKFGYSIGQNGEFIADQVEILDSLSVE